VWFSPYLLIIGSLYSLRNWQCCEIFNMAAPMTECMKYELRSVIWFLYSECVKTREIYRRMTVECDDNCKGQRKVTKTRKNQWTEEEYWCDSELPSTGIFVEVREQIDNCIQNNWIIKLAKLYLKWRASVQEWLKTQPKPFHSNEIGKAINFGTNVFKNRGLSIKIIYI
jgi:hypothetical protein